MNRFTHTHQAPSQILRVSDSDSDNTLPRFSTCTFDAKYFHDTQGTYS